MINDARAFKTPFRSLETVIHPRRFGVRLLEHRSLFEIQVYSKTMPLVRIGL